VFRRNSVAVWNMLRIYPAFWERGFWSSLSLARQAQRKGAMQKLRELAPLLGLLMRRSPGVVVEIGTARGGTFYAWCRVAGPDATIVSIDLAGGPFGGDRATTDSSALRRYGQPGQQLHFIQDDSHDMKTRARLEEILGGREIDFLMIDGDHTYEGVAADYRMYSRFVADGGVIAFHDILPHPQVPECEVDRLWRELRAEGEHVEFTDPDDDRGWGQWGGIGVLVHRA
jgi:predicted O-methyltransferase YrrM